MINATAAWIGFLFGAVSGAIPGLFFHRDTWLGGYTSWPRRLVRLAHISFFGIGFMNLALFLTARDLEIATPRASMLMLVGAISMPLVCYLSAWRQCCRHLFYIPVTSILGAIFIFIYKMVLS